MQTRGASPVPPETSAASPSPVVSSPWSAAAETELRQKAERSYSHWKARATELEAELRAARAALKEGTTIRFMERDDCHFSQEADVLRQKMGRWDKRNWAELAILALRGPRSGDQLDYTVDVRDCVAFKGALTEIHRQRDEESCAWLQAHAFRVEKQLLGKMAHRKSNRRMFWENSMFKFDHSATDKEGNRIRKREMMAKDSSVRAPELYNPKEMLAVIREDECDASGQDHHVESEDRRGAQVRDLETTLLEVIDSAAESACGGMASKGTEGDEHWIIESMDGAGLTHVASGVRVVVYPGSVRRMNQSRNGVRNIATYQATTMAEDHGTLMARCAYIRPQLCKIFKRGYLTRPDGTKVFVKFMLSADKSGICHLMGRRNMNHDSYGTQCDCKDSNDDMYDCTKDPLTHYDHLSFATRVGRAHVAMHEALEETAPRVWWVECSVCGRMMEEDILAERAAREAMSEAELVKANEAHARLHFGQNVDQEPVLPYHDSCTDVLHLYLNIVKVAISQVFHGPFQIEKLDYTPDMKQLMSDLRDKLNARMKQDFDDKKFGGEGVFALIGDQVKIFMRGGHNNRLVPDLLEIAKPYFDFMLTSDGIVPTAPAAPAAPATAAARGRVQPPKPAGSGRGSGRGTRGRSGRTLEYRSDSYCCGLVFGSSRYLSGSFLLV